MEARKCIVRGCALVIGLTAIFSVCGCCCNRIGDNLKTGKYSAVGGNWLRVNKNTIIVGKGNAPYAILENKVGKPLFDPEDEKKLQYSIRICGNDDVALVRDEKAPYERREIVFKKDR